MKLFGITLENSEPSNIVKKLCAALRIRKKVAWLEWLISEVFSEVDVIEITSIHRSRRSGEVIIVLITSQFIHISLHIHSDRRLHIQRYFSDGNKVGFGIIGSCKLYHEGLIFPESYVGDNR